MHLFLGYVIKLYWLFIEHRKSRKTLPKENHLEPTTMTSERKAVDENSEVPDKVIGFDHVSKRESSKAEICESPSQASPVQNLLDQIDDDALDDSEDDTSGARAEQNPLNQTDDALDDSEDDTSGAMPDSAIQRRKLRMVIDPEDDE